MQTEVRANLWLTPSPVQGIVDMSQIRPRRITSGRTEGFAGLAVGAGRIVYALTESQQPDLWSVGLDGSDRQRLTDSGAFCRLSRVTMALSLLFHWKVAPITSGA
jgi:hypothetical protein